ncbi:hypothetical protein ACR6HW_10710 [Fusibacter sp. JL298sf-3]
MVFKLIVANAVAMGVLSVCWHRRRLYRAAVPATPHKPFSFSTGSQMKKDEKAISKNFYRLYKYIHLQISVGTRAEEIYKSLYRVVENKRLKSQLRQMSVIIAQSHDIERGIDYLKQTLTTQEGKTFVNVIDNMKGFGLAESSFMRLDHMLFQKYLSNIRNETEKIKKRYFRIVVLFTIVTTLMLLLPIINQMIVSAKNIFY